MICTRGINLGFTELLFYRELPVSDGPEFESDMAEGDFLFDAVDITSDFGLMEDIY